MLLHKLFGKDRACGSRDVLADRQTHTHTQTYSSQYFTTAQGGKANMISISSLQHS